MTKCKSLSIALLLNFVGFSVVAKSVSGAEAFINLANKYSAGDHLGLDRSNKLCTLRVIQSADSISISIVEKKLNCSLSKNDQALLESDNEFGDGLVTFGNMGGTELHSTGCAISQASSSKTVQIINFDTAAPLEYCTLQ